VGGWRPKQRTGISGMLGIKQKTVFLRFDI